MPSQFFSSPYRLIRRAEPQIGEADRIITAFLNSEPYAQVIDFDYEAGQQVHKIRITDRIPDDVELIVKEACGHLRDALDHACYAAALGLGAIDPRNTGFPFAKDAAGVQGELAGPRLRGNPIEIRSVLEGFKPYDGGNALLWGLNSIRNPNTHRFIVPIASVAGIPHMRSSGVVNGPTQMGYSRWDAANNEVEFMRLGPGSEVEYEAQLVIAVLFDGVHALTRRPVVPSLYAITNEVERVVLAIEAEVARILATRP